MPLTTFKKVIPFIIGLLLLHVGGTWYFRDQGFEPFLFFLGSLPFFFGKHLLIWKKPRAHAPLSNRTKYELRVTGKRLGLKGLSTKPKAELIAAIEATSSTQVSAHHGWAILKWALVLFAAGLSPGTAELHRVLFPRPEESHPRLRLAWYERQEGTKRLRIVDPPRMTAELTPEDIANNHLVVPLQIAIRNDDSVPLRVVKVELSCPVEFDVISKGRAKIDPSGRYAVWTHDIGTLEQEGFYTPLEEVDRIVVPFRFFLDRFVALVAHDVPMLMSTIVGEDVITRKTLELQIRIFCEGRPTIEGVVRVGLESGLELYTDLGLEEFVEIAIPDETDKYLFHNIPKPDVVLTEWADHVTPSNKLVSYRMSKSSNSIYQSVSVEGMLRKVIVDIDSDGNCDLVLMDDNGDGEADMKVLFIEPWPMVDWSRESAK